MDYFDILLAKKLEDDRDPKVEGLSVSANGRYHEDGVVYDPVIVNVPETPLSKLTVTENGTYTAPSGTAYNEVEVDVPLPENAYLLKDIPNTPTAIATFSDGSDLPMPKLEVGIEPVQEGSGDPSPENVRPISGWDEVNVTRTGKNLLDISSIVIGEGVSSTGAFQNASNDYARTVFIRVKPNTTYYYSNLGNVVGWFGKHGAEYSSNDVNTFTQSIGAGGTSSASFTTSATTNYVVFTLLSNSTQAQFEEGSEPTTYEPYNGHTYTIDLDGTRYGGKVDLVSGVMTVDRGYADLGTLSWTWVNNNAWRVIDNTIKRYGGSVVPNILCSEYKAVSGADIYNGVVTQGVCLGNGYYTGDNSGIVVRDDVNLPSSANPNTVLNGVQLVYELATPLTIQLPTTVVKSLRGVNNISADSGDVLDLSYLAKEE